MNVRTIATVMLAGALSISLAYASQVVVPPDPRGLVIVRVEVKLIRLYEATREILEVLD